MKTLLLTAVSLSILTACGPSAEEVDQNQVITQQNAEYNLRRFIQDNVDNAIEWNIQSDSTVSASCPSGDGWASGTIKTGTGELEVKCQTTGSGKGSNGCLLVTDFNKKEYAQQEGNCDSSLGKLAKLEKQ